MRPTRFLAAVGASAMTASALTATVLLATGSGPSPVHLAAAASTTAHGAAAPDPATFHGTGTNRWFPLQPGTVQHLRGHDGGQHYRETVTVTDRTRRIQGVHTTVVRDVVRRLDGTLAERTHDWYAADDAGRVWYFGEATGTYRRDGSVVDHDGSWQAGRDGARAGVVMPARPHATQAFRQEYERGVAEDQAWIVQNGARTTTPAGSFDHVVRSLEWARLEPGVVSVKFYAPGRGLVAEKDLAGGREVFELVSTSHR